MERQLAVNIKNLLRRFDKTTFFQPLYEAIINSLDANATDIKITTLKIKDKDSEIINGFEVDDNGDGFTQENIDSFCELYDEKPEKGKLGSGRFMSLVVFKTLSVESYLKEKTVRINLNANSKCFNIEEDNTKNKEKHTKITFKNVNDNFEHEIYNLNSIKLNIENYLLPRLSYMVSKNIKFCIYIDDLVKIDRESVYKLNTKEFEIPFDNEKKEKFELFYHISKDIPNNSCYYIAHNRKVKDFTNDAKLNNNLPNDNKAILILASSYFDNNVSDDRNSFKIDMNNTSEKSPISLSTINTELVKNYKEIILNKFPDIIEEDKKITDECIKERPYLTKYIKKDTSFLKSKSKIFDNAEKELENEKKVSIRNFEKILENKIGKKEEFEKIWGQVEDISVRELGKYIVYRQQIIDYLQKLNNDNEKIESFLHNLLIKKNTVVSDTDDTLLKQNLWLLDDKFMSFSKCYSDKTFNQIKQIMEKGRVSKRDNGSDRPDILSVYLSDSEEHPNIDCLIIELKGIGTSDDEKNKSITELTRNVGTLRENFSNIRNVYSIIITKIDEDFRKTLNGQDFTPCLENNSNTNVEYYYHYYKNYQTHSYAISTDIIANNAYLRNKIFMDILMGKKD